MIQAVSSTLLKAIAFPRLNLWPWMESSYQQTIRCPSVDVPFFWKHAGFSPDLLKVDIEGSELPFLRQCPDFVRTFNRVMVEWHKPRSDEETVISLMSGLGFDCFKATRNEWMGVCYFIQR